MKAVRSVVMLTNAVPEDKLGGLERYVRELSTTLVTMDIEVTIIAKNVNGDAPSSEIASDGVRIIRHNVPAKTNKLFALQYPAAVFAETRRALRASPASTVIHGHFAPTTASTALRLKRMPYVYTFIAPVYREIVSERQGSYLLSPIGEKVAVSGMRQLERVIVNRATEITVMSEFMRDELRVLSPRAADRAQLIPGGVNTNFFHPALQRTARSEDGSPLLFAARRLTPRTGVAELIKAMPAVIARFPKIHLAIAGAGHQRRELDDLVTQLDVGRHVAFLGRITDLELRDWYQRADLTVMPTSALEGFGLSTAESFACGTPVVVTDVGSNRELATLVAPELVAIDGSARSLAATIADVLSRPDELGRLGDVARTVADPLWSWGKVAEQMLDVYSRSLSRAARLD